MSARLESPPSRRVSLAHLPGLDGVRALAVVAVLLFHGGFGWAKGGFLGVTVFFVLSGFLIGGLLLAEHDSRGAIDLGRFWSRRCRRLVPAVLVLVAAIVLHDLFAARPSDGLLGDGIAAMTWTANWRFVLTHQSYGALFSTPSPFQHLWSLAIEEQFYLLLPIAAVVLLRRGRRWFGALVGGAIALSTLAAALLHHAGDGAGRAYYGTDARVAEPLVGVLLALILVGPTGRRHVTRAAIDALDAAAGVSLLALAWLMTSLSERSDGLYRGGFLLTASLAAVVVAAAAQPGGVVERAMAVRRLAALGRISYGIYLFHWPIFVWLTPGRTGLAPLPLFASRVTFTLAAAVASYVFVEQPVRRGHPVARLATVGWGAVTVGLVGGLAVAAPAPVALSGLMTAAAPAGPVPTVVAAAVPQAATTSSSTSTTVTPTTTTAVAPTRRQVVRTTTPTARPLPPSTVAVPTTVAPPPGPMRVAVVGDSMAAGLAGGLLGWAEGRGDVIVYDLSTPSCPLSAGAGQRRLPDGSDFGVRDDCAWWADANNDRMRKFTAFDPDVVIVQDSMNELFDRKLTSWPEFRSVGTTSFDQWLRDQYVTVGRALSARGASVLLLNAVCADWNAMGWHFEPYAASSEGDGRVDATSAVIAQVTAPRVTLVPFDEHICPDGTFTNEVAGVPYARPDGYHLSTEAATTLATTWLGPLALATPHLP